MEEKIGKVILDTTCYPGKDLYSDGAIEDEMLAISRDFAPEEFNRVISERKSWPILYHFSPDRQNVVRFLPVQKTDSVLEIGSGMGAITKALCEKAKSVTCVDLSLQRCKVNALRNQSQENLEVIVANINAIPFRKKFDWVTLVGVLEYSGCYTNGENPYLDFLKKALSLVRVGGHLVIAIENRLGLKYWAGCTEDHVGKYFEGLENYPDTRSVRTFSRKELSDIIDQAGEFKTTFYYPYPDYKFPMTIYSDKRLPKKGELRDNFCNFDRNRIQLFNEGKVYDSLTDAGLFQEFSNSFLVIVERKENK